MESQLEKAPPKVLADENRLLNLEELQSLGLKSYAFCVICQELVLPQERSPFFCPSCQSVVFCDPCIKKWKKEKNTCPNCRVIVDRRTTAFQSCLSKKDFTQVYEMLRLKCRYTEFGCQTEANLMQIEDHEAGPCLHKPCPECK